MFKPLVHDLNSRLLFGALIIASVMILFPQTAHAAGSAMPWEAPLTKILQSIEGPVAKIFGTVVIIMTGLGLAFGDTGAARGSITHFAVLAQAGRSILKRRVFPHGAIHSRLSQTLPHGLWSKNGAATAR